MLKLGSHVGMSGKKMMLGLVWGLDIMIRYSD